MAVIQFVDQTLRDGQQSLWGMRMRAGMVTPVAPYFDRGGFKAVEIGGGGGFLEVLLRNVREEPWDVLDHLRRSMPNAHLRASRRANAMGKMGLTPAAMLEVFNRTLVKHGLQSFWIFDCLYDMTTMERVAREIVACGGEVYPGIQYGISPVHTDEFFADRCREIASWGVASGIYFEDAPGILTPERADTLLPAMIAAAGDTPIEMHGHNTVGLANLNYLKAVEHGITTIHTCSRPLANGPSLPSTEMMAHSLQVLGHEVAIDESVLPPIAEHFERVAAQEGWPLGVPVEYDVGLYQHQLPGGMMGTLKAQLAQHGMEDHLPALLAELPQIRDDLGHPISATPFAQLMGVQAVLNVTTGERYSVIPDEIVMFVLGHYGKPPGKLNPELVDRVTSSERGRQLAGWELEDPTLDELRVQYGGAQLTDEELIVRYLASPEDIQATKDAGPLKTTYTFTSGASTPGLVDRVMNLTRARAVDLRLPDVSVSFRRTA
jgi:oxaloacetate decarboxylase alpha subunit